MNNANSYNAPLIRPQISEAIRRLVEVSSSSSFSDSDTGSSDDASLLHQQESYEEAAAAAAEVGAGNGAPPAPLNEAELAGLGDAIIQYGVDVVDLAGSLLGSSPRRAANTFLKRILLSGAARQPLTPAPSPPPPSLSLICLNVSHCNLKAKQVRLIAKLLKFSSGGGLKVLHLGHNKKVGDAGAEELASAIGHDNVTLRELYLNSTRIGPDGAKALGAAIMAKKKSSPLRVLDLSNNHIGDEGTEAIASAVSSNKKCHLKELRLIRNGIGPIGSKALATMLHQNNYLVRLHLVGNPKISFMGTAALENVLIRDNFTLEELKVDDNPLPYPHNNNIRINQHCARNRNLKSFGKNLRKTGDNISHAGLWPKVLERIESKPDLLFETLRNRPQIFDGAGLPREEDERKRSKTKIKRLRPRKLLRKLPSFEMVAKRAVGRGGSGSSSSERRQPRQLKSLS